tara:strand:- start:1287 stop:1472 length:186 start_codon:yes stop_codon:yes gene_type:complete
MSEKATDFIVPQKFVLRYTSRTWDGFKTREGGRVKMGHESSEPKELLETSLESFFPIWGDT